MHLEGPRYLRPVVIHTDALRNPPRNTVKLVLYIFMIMNSFMDFNGTGLDSKAHQVMRACRTGNILPTL